MIESAPEIIEAVTGLSLSGAPGKCTNALKPPTATTYATAPTLPNFISSCLNLIKREITQLV